MWLTCQSNIDVLGPGVIRCKPINQTIQKRQLISTDVVFRYVVFRLRGKLSVPVPHLG